MVRTSHAAAITATLAAATLALWVLSPIGWLLTAIVWVLVAPLPRSILGRAVLLSGVFTVCTSLWLLFGGGLSASGLQVAGTGLNLGLAVAALTGRTIMARIDWAAGVVLLGSATLFAQQIWVERGSSPDQLLSLLMASGDDNESHFTLYANSVQQGGEPWVTATGGAPQFAGYPGGHTAVTVALTRMFLQLPGSPARVDLFFPYVVTNAMTVALAGIALGMIAVGVARALSRGHDEPAAGFWAALIVMLAVTVDTLVYPLAAAGHGNMLFGACLTAALSWLAITMLRSSVGVSTAILVLVLYVGWATWPPVALVSVVPGLALVWRLVGGRRWLVVTLMGAAGAGIVLVARVVGHQFGTSIGTLSTAPGGNAGFNLSLVMAGIGVCIPMWVWARRRLDQEPRIYVAMGWVPIAVAAAAFGAAAVDRAVPWQASYYTVKMLNAVALWFAPVVAGVLGLVVCLGLATLNRTALRPHEKWAAGVSVAAVFVAGSGYFGPGASGLKPGMFRAYAVLSIQNRQSVAAGNAVGAAMLRAQAATAAYPDSVAVFADDSTLMNNRWLSTLRSVPSEDGDRLFATTMTAPDGPTRHTMIIDWVRTDPAAKLVAICSAEDGCPDLADGLSAFKDRATLVRTQG